MSIKKHRATTKQKRWVISLVSTAAVLVCYGCGTGMLGMPSIPVETANAPFVATALGVGGATDAARTVVIGTLADEDAKDDSLWRANFLLSGGGDSNSLAVDAGEEQTYEIYVLGSRVSDSDVVRKLVTITLYSPMRAISQ